MTTSLRDMRIWELHQRGESIRSIARQVGLSRSRVHEIVSAPAPDMSPMAYLGPEDDEADPWDEDELPLALADDDAREPHEFLTPPFDYVGLVEVPDNLPTRRQDGKLRQAPEWRDGNGEPVGELDLYRWGQGRLAEVTPDRYVSRDAYLAAWDAAEAETEAARAHADESLRAAGVEWDEARRRYVQRPQAV